MAAGFVVAELDLVAACVVHIADGRQIAVRAVIVAPGTAWRRLGKPRLEALLGSGLFLGSAGSAAQAMKAATSSLLEPGTRPTRPRCTRPVMPGR